MNLLVGLAVSDIQVLINVDHSNNNGHIGIIGIIIQKISIIVVFQGLQKSAGLDRLVRQTELISHIESMLFSRLLSCLPKRLLTVMHQEALVVPHGYSWSFTIRPNDLREDRLPRDITEGVHWLVSMRYVAKYPISMFNFLLSFIRISPIFCFFAYISIYYHKLGIGQGKDVHLAVMQLEGE